MMPAYVHRAAGGTTMAECVGEPAPACWFCGGEAPRTAAVSRWVKDGFTAGAMVRAPSSTRVCEACVFVCSRLSPVPGRPPAEGKKFGGNYRNYSHCVEVTREGSTYANASKAENDRISGFLRRHKAGDWFCAVAKSGQKHVISWANRNGPGRRGVVSFDDVLVQIPDDDKSWALLDDVESLLKLGVPRAAILDGRWPAELMRKLLAELREFDRKWGSRRASGWFDLVCHLAMNRNPKKGKR